MMTNEIDAAMLWARERMMDEAAKLGDAVCATEFQSGAHDASELIVTLCSAFRAGHSANAERVAVLEAENARLREEVERQRSLRGLYREQVEVERAIYREARAALGDDA
jgi:hypothetical protein